MNWEDGSAIHGLVASSPWDVIGEAADTLALQTLAVGGPYRVRGEMDYTLEPASLQLHLTAVNVGDTAVPMGLGIHPWFRGGRLLVPADRKWPGDPLPVGPPVPVDDTDDLRAGRVPPVMDRCFTSLTSDRVEVPGVGVSWTGPITQVVVYTGDPGWMAVEPVTMANDGIGLAGRGVDGHGVQVVEPNDRLTVVYRFDRL